MTGKDYSASITADITPQEATERIKRVADWWTATDCNLHFVGSKKEWKDTRVVFEISTDGMEMTVTMAHAGLAPGVECYEACSNGGISVLRRACRSCSQRTEVAQTAGTEGKTMRRRGNAITAGMKRLDKEPIMAKVILGNHSSVIVPVQDRDGIRKFYCDARRQNHESRGRQGLRSPGRELLYRVSLWGRP